MTTTYTVRANDTLTKIAAAHNTTVDELVRLNGIKNKDSIQVGRKLIFEEPKQETKNAVSSNESYENVQNELAKTQKQLASMEAYMNKPEESSINGWEVLGYGVAGAAVFNGARNLAPYAKSAAETGYLRALYAGDKMKTGANKMGNVVKGFGDKMAQKAKHAAKKAELEYAFGKDAAKNAVNQAGQSVNNGASNVKRIAKHAAKKAELEYAFGKDAAKNGAKRIVSASKNNVIKSGKIMKLTKAGKAVSKRLPGVAQTVAIAEVAVAYGKGGAKAAGKQAVKSGSGLAMGAAGTKIGAAIGTAICPGVGTAIGAVVGGVAGYIAGEGLADKVLSLFS